MIPDSAIERATRAAEAKLLHIEARDGAFYEHAEDVAKACLAAAYPQQTEGERGAVWTLRKILDLTESTEGDDSFARAAGALAEIADLAEDAIAATQSESAPSGEGELHDALRALYNAVDRWGWFTGTDQMDTRDAILAKADSALKDAQTAC